MDYTERGSHARGVYPRQYTSRMGTVSMKQESSDLQERKVGTKGKKLKQHLTSTKDPVVLLYWYYHILYISL